MVAIREAAIMTEQKSADCAVADEEHVARSISSQDVFDLADDAQLCIDCSFPSPDAYEGLCEKLMGHRLKLIRWQKACG
jgi:hypothetical protein